MAHTGAGRQTVAPTEHERDVGRTADPARGTDESTGFASAHSTPDGQRRFERAQPQPAERHE